MKGATDSQKLRAATAVYRAHNSFVERSRAHACGPLGNGTPVVVLVARRGARVIDVLRQLAAQVGAGDDDAFLELDSSVFFRAVGASR